MCIWNIKTHAVDKKIDNDNNKWYQHRALRHTISNVLMRLCFLSAVIEPCMDAELNEFPLRMRDWLKNVLVTLYERDEDNNLLTEKQKLRVSS